MPVIPAPKQDKPKAVKEKEILQFRRELYEQQLRHNRCIPSTAASWSNDEQNRCPHHFDNLKRSANAEGHFARCRACDLEVVRLWIIFSITITFSMRCSGRCPPFTASEPRHDLRAWCQGPPWSTVFATHLRQIVGDAFPGALLYFSSSFVSLLEQLCFRLAEGLVKHPPQQLKASWSSIDSDWKLFDHISGFFPRGQIHQHSPLLRRQAIETLLSWDGALPFDTRGSFSPVLFYAH